MLTWIKEKYAFLVTNGNFGWTDKVKTFKQSDPMRNDNSKLPRFIAIFIKLSSHLVDESFGPQPDKRDDPTLLKTTVLLFI